MVIATAAVTTPSRVEAAAVATPPALVTGTQTQLRRTGVGRRAAD